MILDWRPLWNSRCTMSECSLSSSKFVVTSDAFGCHGKSGEGWVRGSAGYPLTILEIACRVLTCTNFSRVEASSKVYISSNAIILEGKNLWLRWHVPDSLKRNEGCQIPIAANMDAQDDNADIRLYRASADLLPDIDTRIKELLAKNPHTKPSPGRRLRTTDTQTRKLICLVSHLLGDFRSMG
jgi:hypothetical protein